MYQQRKVKANELDDNFDYIASKDNNKTKEKEDEGIIN